MNGSVKITLKVVGAIVGLVLGVGTIVGLVLSAGGWIAYAEGTHKQTRTNTESNEENTKSIDVLTDLWKNRETKEDAAATATRETIRRFCQSGKFEPTDPECRYLEGDD